MEQITGCDSQPPERRSIERYELRLLGIVHPPEASEPPQELYTRDVSCEGAYFSTGRPLPLDAQVRVTLYLPPKGFGRSKISTQGQVVRTDGEGIAVHFKPSYRISRA